MKITLKVEKEFEIKTLLVKAGVRYYEDGTVNGVEDKNGDLIPCKVGQLWCPLIDIETGKILNWKQGTKAEVHYKVCDQCGWELKDGNGIVVLEAEDGYVPSTLYPEGDGYGDYIIMNIDESGQIDKWRFDVIDFKDEEE